jgi:excisionase family DNA binding protein
MSIEETLRGLVAQVVRDELRKLATGPADEYLSTNAAAKLADVAAGTIRRWVKNGRLRNYHAGRLVRISKHDLERLMRDGSASNDSLNPEQLATRKYA